MEGNMQKFAFGALIVSIVGAVLFPLISLLSSTTSLLDGIIIAATLALFVSSGVAWLLERRGAPLTVRIVFRVLVIFITLVWLFIFSLWIYDSVLAPSDEEAISKALENSGVDFSGIEF